MGLTPKTAAQLLFAGDTFLAKAVSSDPQAAFRLIEGRLNRSCARAFAKRGDQGIRTALTWIRQGKGDILPQDVKVVLTILEASFWHVEREIEPFIEAGVERAYIEGQKLARAQIARRARRSIRKSAINASFSLIDENAIRAFVRHQRFWIGQHYAENLSDRVAEIATELMIRRGYGRQEAAEQLEKALRAEFGLEGDTGLLREGIKLPGGWKGTTAEYFAGVAVNTTTVARVSGAIREFQRARVSTYQWVAVGDDRTCLECSFMDGKVFASEDGGGVVDRLVSAKTPESVKSIPQWDKLNSILRRSGLDKTDRGRVSAAKSQQLIKAGYGMPPLHFKCRCTIDIADDATIGALNYDLEYENAE